MKYYLTNLFYTIFNKWGKILFKNFLDVVAIKKFDTYYIKTTASIVEYSTRKGLKAYRSFVQIKYTEFGEYPYRSETIQNFNGLGISVVFYWNITRAQYGQIKTFLCSFAPEKGGQNELENLLILLFSNEYEKAFERLNDITKRSLEKKSELEASYNKEINLEKKDLLSYQIKRIKMKFTLLDKIQTELFSPRFEQFISQEKKRN